MDSPKRSLKGVTERNPSRCPFSWSQSWELRAALLVPIFQELVRNTDSLRKSMLKKKMQHTGSLKVDVPWHRAIILSISLIWTRILCVCVWITFNSYHYHLLLLCSKNYILKVSRFPVSMNKIETLVSQPWMNCVYSINTVFSHFSTYNSS